MTQTIGTTDSFLTGDELRHFVIFLENCDGNEWNRLRRDLSILYKERTCDADYLSKATFRATEFVQVWKSRYWASYANDKVGFYHYQTSFIAAAAVQIAYGEMEEFKLGNYTL